MNKKVLIITYYWPPSGGSGVQRWLKFVKYLPQYGWLPYVFTPENPSFNLKDESLLKDVPEEAEVIHFPIWEPYDYFFKLSRLLGVKKSDKPADVVSGANSSLFQKMSRWIRANLFIPDPRVFWVKPSVNFLKDFLSENDISAIITTGPPHSVHLIGYNLKKNNPKIKWIADFRDPWSEWGLLDSLKVSATIRRKHQQLEYNVLSSADVVTTITPFYVRHFERLGKRNVNLLTNGFDEDDFRHIEYKKSEKFIIRHVGIVNEKCNPRPFMEVILSIINQDKDFASKVQIEFIGEVNSNFRKYITDNNQLSSVTVFIPSIPHKELIKVYGSSSLLLLVLTGYRDAEGYMPGKLFEYLATGLPILGIGPENGDAGKLLEQTMAGRMISDSKQEEVANYIINIFKMWLTNETTSGVKESSLIYSRRGITKSLTKILESEGVK